MAVSDEFGAVRIRHVARLKLRVMRNSFRGQPWRIVAFVLGALFGLYLAGVGFFMLAAPGLYGDARTMVIVSAFAGTVLVLGWLLIPLLFFGVDETLDPARFALLPLPRPALIAGLFSAALLGVPALALLGATSGLVLGAVAQAGWLAGLVQAVGVVAGLLLCVAASRAVTSAFATMLRSRRMRDLAAVVLALLAVSIGPLQLAVVSTVQQANLHRLAGPARVLGWTPLAAPYTVGADVAGGDAWAVPVKLAITGAAIAGLVWWWASSLERAMVGTTASASVPAGRGAQGGPVEQLFPRALGWLPRTAHGAIVAREARSWWRDTRRRISLIMVVAVGVLVPIMLDVTQSAATGGGGRSMPVPTVLAMLLVGVYAGVALANQFGFDGSAYATHLVVGVAGRTELAARVVAFSAYLVPLLAAVTVTVAAAGGEAGWLPTMLGCVFAAYGTGVAANLVVSVLGAYPVPESSNPFTMNTGRGTARGLLALVALVATVVITTPFLVLSLLGRGSVLWSWLVVPAGIGYGLAAVVLGLYLVGDMLDRRGPELLLAVTPRR